MLVFLTIFQFLALPFMFTFKKKFLPFSLFFFSVLLAIISAQASALYVTGFYIPALAISNISQIHEIGYKGISYFILFYITGIIITFVKISIFKTRLSFTLPIVRILCCLLLIIPKTPTCAFIETLYQFINEEIITYQVDSPDFSKKLLKEYISKNSNAGHYINSDKIKNIIVIFTEGISSKIISQDITPHLYTLRNKSLDIIRYYNHTAATFRGLRGQLSSSFQMKGGYNSDNSGIAQMNKKDILKRYGDDGHITPLPVVLKSLGYDTYFQASNKTDSQLSIMLKTLGFDTIYGLENFRFHKPWQIEELSDKESYEMLLDKITHIKQPFFYGIYTIGTHTGLDSPDIKYKDGKNVYLNKFHNMDHQFGKFIDAFNKNKISDNTLLIFTADHSTYPEKEFRQTFKTESIYFVDEIPFIIYQKGITPDSIDVKGMNSLSLTPTILDMIGLKHYRNKFIGASIFDSEKAPPENCISAIGRDYFSTCNGLQGKVSILNDKSKIEKIKKLQIYGR